jgi:short-subunit dehydrogenase
MEINVTTLITGASTGLGAEFARQLAKRGHDLVLVARSADKMETLAKQLRKDPHVSATVIPMDLAHPDAAQRLWNETQDRGLKVDLLINNAGFATHGDVADADPARLAEEIQLNCVTLTGLTTYFVPAMRAAGKGGVINVASTVAFQPVPHMAVYGATKAYVLSFTEALWRELKGTGVRVLAVAPGATDTPFFEVAGEHAAAGSKRTPEQLVNTALRAYDGRKPTVVDGLGNAFVARVVTRLFSRRIILSIAERAVRPS